MHAVVQDIVTVWTTRSRGAPGARARAATPWVWPCFVQGPARWLVERVTFSERNGFAAPNVIREHHASDAFELGPLEIRVEARELVTRYCDVAWMRAPPRCLEPRRILRLGLGEHGRVAFNGRRVVEVGWIYEQHVVNVAWLAAEAPVRFDGTPVATADLRVRLR